MIRAVAAESVKRSPVEYLQPCQQRILPTGFLPASAIVSRRFREKSKGKGKAAVQLLPKMWEQRERLFSPKDVRAVRRMEVSVTEGLLCTKRKKNRSVRSLSVWIL